MLKFGDVSFDLGFERGQMPPTGYLAKISMLRLNIGSSMLGLTSCMPTIARGPSKPNSTLISPNFKILTFCYLGRFFVDVDFA